jgi:hypothetical protein
MSTKYCVYRRTTQIFILLKKIWANVKGWTATRSVTCNLNDVENLARGRFGQITTDDWIHVCTHARNWEEKFRQLEHLFDEAVDTLQFQVNTGSSDEEDCNDNNSSGSDLSGIEPLEYNIHIISSGHKLLIFPFLTSMLLLKHLFD